MEEAEKKVKACRFKFDFDESMLEELKSKSETMILSSDSCGIIEFGKDTYSHNLFSIDFNKKRVELFGSNFTDEEIHQLYDKTLHLENIEYCKNGGCPIAYFKFKVPLEDKPVSPSEEYNDGIPGLYAFKILLPEFCSNNSRERWRHVENYSLALKYLYHHIAIISIRNKDSSGKYYYVRQSAEVHYIDYKNHTIVLKIPEDTRDVFQKLGEYIIFENAATDEDTKTCTFYFRENDDNIGNEENETTYSEGSTEKNDISTSTDISNANPSKGHVGVFKCKACGQTFKLTMTEKFYNRFLRTGDGMELVPADSHNCYLKETGTRVADLIIIK